MHINAQMRLFPTIILATVMLMPRVAFSTLVTTLQLDAAMDSDPTDPNNIRVTASCVSTSSCNLTVTSGQNSGSVFTSIGATYGSISAHYLTDLISPVGTIGNISGNMVAGFFDDLRLHGRTDYGFAQITISGVAGKFLDGPSPLLNVGSNFGPVGIPFGQFSPDPFTVVSPLIALNQNHLALNLTLDAMWSLPFTHPGGITDLDAQITRIQFFDVNQIPISQVFYSDDSGVAYAVDGGVLVPEPIPEVSPAILLGTILIALFWTRRRALRVR